MRRREQGLNTMRSLRSFLRSTAALGMIALVAQPAFAQEAEGEAVAEGAAEEESVILVTGSRIRSPNLESTVPVTAVSGEEFFETGQTSIGDVLNELPQLRTTMGLNNGTRFLGTRGLNLLDLRGLSPHRTLVLVNGRRHVAADILSQGVSPDTNTFPTDLIERVDIVTGGNSSIYGSDAIAGVVNFVLKDDFEGLQIRGQSGVSKYGDADNHYVSVLAGTNFGGGRGNIAANLEYSHQNAYYADARPHLRQNDVFVVVDSDPAGSTNGADDIIDRVFFQDVRSATIAPGGQVGIRFANSAAPCGRDGVGSAFTCASLFNPDGSLVAQTGLRVGLGPNGSFVGGNGSSNRQARLLALSPDLERYSINLVGHYEVSPAFVPFFEAKYVRTDAKGSQSGPFFSQGQTLADGVYVDGFFDRSYQNGRFENNVLQPISVNREGIRLDNPYLSNDARAELAKQLTAAINSGVNPNTGVAYHPASGPTSQSILNQTAALEQVEDGSFRFSLRRNWLDLGIRDERIKRETYRFVGGVRGDFNDDWNYELSLNYGQHEERNRIQGNVNVQRFILAQDSAVDPLTGKIVCRSQIDARYAGGDIGGDPSVLAADIAACVPINPFGQGSVTPEARNYLLVPSEAGGKITQFVASGYVSGDSSQWFELPGGPVGFSIGAEYRRETNEYHLDHLTQAGYAFYNAIPSFTAPAFAVKEAFGELRIPLVNDLPLLRELTISASGRVADYRGATGTVFAYSGGVDWRPIDDLRFRGTYSHSVRAPNLSEIYSPQGQNFAPSFVDPCSDRNIATGSAHRVANCNAAGRPAGFDYVYSSSLETLSGGNPNLTEESSNSWTIGGVYTPSFLPGFSVSADYYDITVGNVIEAVLPQQIANLCYDSPSLDNQFCALFQRAGANGGPRGEIPFQILEGTLLQASTNFAKLRARGIDTNVGYTHDLGWGTLKLNAIWTHVLQRDDFTNPSDPNFKNRILGELGDPKNQVNLDTSLKVGKVTVGYEMRWIDDMYLNTYEDLHSLNDLPPQNADFGPIRTYPDVFYHDIRLNAEVDDQFNIYGGIDNFTNTKPPYGLTGVAAGSGIYDTRGRYFYVGFKANF